MLLLLDTDNKVQLIDARNLRTEYKHADKVSGSVFERYATGKVGHHDCIFAEVALDQAIRIRRHTKIYR